MLSLEGERGAILLIYDVAAGLYGKSLLISILPSTSAISMMSPNYYLPEFIFSIRGNLS
jgi:hypothetical protein